MASSYTVDKLAVHVHATRAELGAAASRDIVAHLQALLAARPGLVRVVFAAAPSQTETLQGLVAAAKAVDWSRIEAFHMDEYIGLPRGALQAFSAFLRQHIWDSVAPGAVHTIASEGAASPAALAEECARYAALLSAAPIDVVILGIGENGHLAFNDPPVCDFADAVAVKAVELELACRQQQVNDGCFACIEDVPTHALTLTVPALVAGQRLFCVVPGPTKRKAVTATLTGSISPACPASILRTHPQCTLYVDQHSFDADTILPAVLPPSTEWTTEAISMSYSEDPNAPLVLTKIGISSHDGCIVAVENKEVLPTSLSSNSGPFLIVGAGLVDLQVNGFLGVDFNTLHEHGCASAAILDVIQALKSHGVTSFYPTLITNHPASTIASLEALAAACDAHATIAAAVAGVHLEGPFISALDGYRGAHDAAYVQPPNLDLFRQWQRASGGRIKMVTLAPELPGSEEFIKEVSALGVVVSIGHSAASQADISAAVRCGARCATHLGNAAPAVLPRHPNVIWELLAEDLLAAGFIADGHHLPDCVLKAIMRCKGPQRSFLVSDSVSVAGLPPGEHNTHVGGRVVLTPEGRLHLASDARLLAGSVLTLDKAVARMAFTPGLLETRSSLMALRLAWSLASKNPASLAGLRQSAGLTVGAPADFGLFEVKGGHVSAKTVWKNGVPTVFP